MFTALGLVACIGVGAAIVQALRDREGRGALAAVQGPGGFLVLWLSFTVAAIVPLFKVTIVVILSKGNAAPVVNSLGHENGDDHRHRDAREYQVREPGCHARSTHSASGERCDATSASATECR